MPQSTDQLFSEDVIRYHLGLLGLEEPGKENEEACLAPILSSSILKCGESTEGLTKPGISQFGLLAGVNHMLESREPAEKPESLHLHKDPRLLFNVTSLSSTFICNLYVTADPASRKRI